MVTTVELALMAGRAYLTTRNAINQFAIPEGWSEFYHVPDPANPSFLVTDGFEAVSFRRDNNPNEIVISFAGTGALGDWPANVGLATGFGSNQLCQAALYYCQVKAANPNAQITFTGHSLGGGLASLLGVFFDRPAVTFDQAPFRLSATTGMRDELLTYLGNSGFVGTDLQPLSDFIGLNCRAGNVTGLYIQGEFITTTPPFSAFYGIGAQAPLTHGDYFGPIDLHSQALLAAFVQNIAFRQITFKLPDLLGMIFDSKLYKKDTDTTSENFIERLVRHQAGVRDPVTGTVSIPADKMLDRFTTDLQKIAQDGGLTMTSNDLTKALIAFAMQMYYEKTTAADKFLFSNVAGGIRFDRSDVADTLAAAKGYALYFTNYLATLPASERDLIVAQLPGLLDWFIQAGHAGMNATADTRRAFMLGAGKTDVLTGGNAADLIFGGAGDDYLMGREGDDVLIGGDGYDVYYWREGDGKDRIVDADNKGMIVIDAQGYELVACRFLAIEGQANTWRSPDGQITLTHNASWKLGLAGGGEIDLGENFTSGDYGIHLNAALTAPQIGRTILGDLTPIDADPGKPGIQHAYDDIGNLLVDPNQPEPDRADDLRDSAGNDLVRALGGNDTIRAVAGGDDRLEGDVGDDSIMGGEGKDLLLGGVGTDVLAGEEGDDRLFGSEEIELAQAISMGNTQAGTGQKGDWLNGGVGNDIQVAGADNDVLLGGGGDDILVGGAGDDVLDGDDNFLTYNHEWTIAVHSSGNIFNRDFVGAYSLNPTPLVGGADVLYGGKGNDHLGGLIGDDILFGEDGDDTLGGQDGSDVLVGGSGNDKLTGDHGRLAYESTGQVIVQGDDYLDGGDGDDWLQGEGGNDDLFGGAGKDELWGDAGYLAADKHGDDYLDGEDGDDQLVGQGGADELFGGAGNDKLFGDDDSVAAEFQKDDYLDGEDGDDSLQGFGGNDDLFGGAGNDYMLGQNGNDYLDGEKGNDSLSGGEGDDTLTGGEGRDYILGEAGNDSLEGGAGADTLAGGAGNDRYHAEGSDIIVDFEGKNAINLGAASPTSLTLSEMTSADGQQYAVLTDALSGDQVSIANGFLGAVAEYEFADGTVLQHKEVMAAANAGDLKLKGTADTDRIFGGSGNDTLLGQAGDDELAGNAGNDQVFGGAGNDMLEGGIGNDTLGGGAGNDAYRYALGDGFDTINDAGELADADTLAFGAGIQKTDVVFSRKANGDLVAALADGSGGITFTGWSSAANRIERFEFADGTVIEAAALTDLPSVPIVGSTGNDTLAGTSYGEHIVGGEGDDVLTGLAGNDQLEGGEGQDTYVLERGGGLDIVVETGAQASTIQLGDGLGVGDLAAMRQGDDLILSIRGTQTGLTIQAYFATEALWSLEDAAGQSQSLATALAQIDALEGTLAGFWAAHKAQAYEQLAANELGHGLLQLSGTSFAMPHSGLEGYFHEETIWTTTQIQQGTPPQISTSTTSESRCEGSLLWSYDSLPRHWSYTYSYTTLRQESNEAVIRGDNTPVSTDQDTAALFTVSWGEPYAVYSTLRHDVGTQAIDGGTVSTDYVYQDEYYRRGGTIQDIGEVPANWTVGPNVVAGNQVVANWRQVTNNFFGVNEIIAGDADSLIITASNGGTHYRAATVGMVDAGAGNDTVHGQAGDFLYGNAGDDVIYGGGAVLVGGDGHDRLFGGEGADRFLLLGSEHGIKLVQDAGSDLERYKDWYFRSQGIDDWRRRETAGGKYLLWDGEGGAYDTPAEAAAAWNIADVDALLASGELVYIEPLPPLPQVGSTDYASIEILVAAGIIAPDTIELPAGIVPSDLQFSWGRAGGLNNAERTVLEIAWGGEARLQVLLPDVDDPLGTGIERFRFADGAELTMAQMLDLASTIPADTSDSIFGADSDDMIGGADAGEWLEGRGGNDTLFGNGGNDVLDGGAGNDYLSGGAGNDVYRFGRGGGSDLVMLDDAGIAGTDRVCFTDYVAPGDVAVSRDFATLLLTIGDTGETIALAGWFDQPAARKTIVEFADGTVWDGAALDAMAARTIGTAGDDTLWGTAGDDTLSGLGGVDNVFGGAGEDILAGGADYDYLEGGTGNDVYRFDSGAGDEDICDNGSPTDVDSLRFGEGISPQDIVVTRDEFSLYLNVSGTTDTAILDGWFWNEATRVERVEFADGTVWDGATLADRIPHSNAAPVAVQEIAAQTATETAPFAFQIPAGVFVDPDPSDVLAFGATLANGGDLPAWLSFDPVTRTFSGTPASASAGILSVRVTATDAAGASASGDFVLDIANHVQGSAGADTLAGSALRDAIEGLAGDDFLNGKAGADTLIGGAGNDTCRVDDAGDVVVEATGEGTDRVVSTISYTLPDNIENLTLAGIGSSTGTGNALGNVIVGNAAANLLDGGAGDDTLKGGVGADILQGGAGNDRLIDALGGGAFNGGAGNDTLAAGDGSELLIGGLGRDILQSGLGSDVIAFNAGDGQDTLGASAGGDNTLSLGGNFAYGDLVFRKNGNNLILKVGASDRITLANWYAGSDNRSVLTLQVIAEAMSDFDAGGADPLLDDKVETFDFAGLANAFDAALAANPGITSWALTNALTTFHLSGSDSEALGGDLAYQYGRNGNLGTVGLTAAENILGAPQFGSVPQALLADAQLQQGVVRLS